MSNGNSNKGNRNRGNQSGGGGGNSNQQRRRGRGRSGNAGGGGGGGSQGAGPNSPVMTSLGESTYEAVFDHGNNGYGVWFDGMVRDDPIYKQHWKGNRSIFVRIEDDRIVISKQLANQLVQDLNNATEGAADNGQASDDEPQAVSAGGDDSGDDAADESALASRSFDPDDIPERVYSPEEAAQLFAAEAGETTEAAPEAEAKAKDEGEDEAPVRARRKVTTRKRAPAKPKAEPSGDE